MLAEESFTIVTPCLKRFSLASGVVKIFAPERKDREKEREREREREIQSSRGSEREMRERTIRIKWPPLKIIYSKFISDNSSTSENRVQNITQ